MQLDFFARRPHYVDHMAPVYNALPHARRGVFHIAQELESYARQELREPRLEIFQGGIPAGDNPIIVAAYGDLNKVIRNPQRKIITIEHGVTQGFGTAAYPNGTIGNRDRASFALLPNEYVARHFRAVRQTPCAVIGTPKMDAYLSEWVPVTRPVDPGRPVLAIAFHWGNRNENPPESGSAWEHYKDILLALGERYQVIGHSHPLAAPIYREAFERVGIEWVEDFREVCRLADIYLNDLSSTMYEFLLTGKPVVVLNAPWFRREIHWGIRFWDYSDVGINVESPFELFDAIDQTLEQYATICLQERRQAIADLYPYVGHSARRAVDILERWIDERS
jgi:Putative glycosyl/glycerophosphate transferases involved in teichoic acid biosynthesis TagF/TagB/EpsJ/RodC